MPSLLECATCGCAQQFWNYRGLVDESYDNMTLATPHQGTGHRRNDSWVTTEVILRGVVKRRLCLTGAFDRV